MSFLSSIKVTTSAIPAIVVHANEIQPRFAAFIELDFAADWRLPQELACLEVLEDDSSSPDVLHGVADRLQVPLGGPCVCVGLIVHVVVYQTHLSLLTTCNQTGGDSVSACAELTLQVDWSGKACDGGGEWLREEMVGAGEQGSYSRVAGGRGNGRGRPY